MFGRKRRPAIAPTSRAASSRRAPANARAYAIGDVHGRLDLLTDLLEQVAADRSRNRFDRDYLIFLGDLIDRGPDSCGVIELLLERRASLPNPVFLMGNHEEMLLRVLDGETARVHDWLAFGGYAFAQSYGVEVGRLGALDDAEAAATIRLAVPEAHRRFIGGFADSFRFGDYLFVHAGIRPGKSFEAQIVSDLRWIREEFLDSEIDHGFCVVHGHTIRDRPDDQGNRIGIDTGAYDSGILTAICIEGDGCRFLQTRTSDSGAMQHESHKPDVSPASETF